MADQIQEVFQCLAILNKNNLTFKYYVLYSDDCNLIDYNFVHNVSKNNPSF